MANWIGTKPENVSAKLDTVEPRHLPVEDVATLDIEFPRSTGRIELSWAAPTRTNDGEIVGTKGSIAIEDECIVVRTDAGDDTRPYGERLSDSSYHPEWFVSLFNKILGDDSRATGQANLREAKMLLTTLFRAYGHTVELTEATAVA
jgi:predicted dehydrogenase